MGGQNYQDLINRIKESADYRLNNPEEFYYLLGQFVIYVFHCLGGANKFKREINYLTNPSQPQTISRLGQRNIDFLKNYPNLVKIKTDLAANVYRLLIDNQTAFIHDSLAEGPCSEAFYQGLYEDNFLLQ